MSPSPTVLPHVKRTDGTTDVKLGEEDGRRDGRRYRAFEQADHPLDTTLTKTTDDTG